MKGPGPSVGGKTPFRKRPARKRRIVPSNQYPSREPTKVGALIAGAFPNLAIKSKLREYRLKKLWPAVVGEGIAKRAEPQRIIGDTLYCVVSSSAWMTELNYQKPVIIEKLNEAAGEKAIKKIIFKPGTVSSQPTAQNPSPYRKRAVSKVEKEFIEKTVSKINDNSLKALIRRVMVKGL